MAVKKSPNPSQSPSIKASTSLLDTPTVADPVSEKPITTDEQSATDEKPAKPAKPKKIKHPQIFDENGQRRKNPETGKSMFFEAWPADYDPAMHTPMLKSYFVDERIYIDHQIEVRKEEIKALEKEKAEFTKYGTAEERKRAQKSKTMVASLVALIAELKASGQDPKDLGIDLNELKGVL